MQVSRGRRRALITALVAVLGLNSAAAQPSYVVVTAGKLIHHRLSNDLFHVNDVWMQVTPDTEFFRWLSDGIDRQATVILTTNPRPFEDIGGARILTGTLQHQISPNASPVLHTIFVHDAVLDTPSPVTFQTTKAETAAKFDPYGNRTVSIVLVIGQNAGGGLE